MPVTTSQARPTSTTDLDKAKADFEIFGAGIVDMRKRA